MKKRPGIPTLTALLVLVIQLTMATSGNALSKNPCIGKFVNPAEVGRNPNNLRKAMEFMKCNEEHSIIKMKPILKRKRKIEVASFGKLTRVKDKLTLQKVISKFCYDPSVKKCTYTKLYAKYQGEINNLPNKPKQKQRKRAKRK